MHGLEKHNGPSPKCYFTRSVLPGFVNHEQIPAKKRPFATVVGRKFNRSLNILIPSDGAESLEKLLDGGVGSLRYLTVFMKLGDLIEGDFFNQYIKTGNILMLSEGRPGIDHTFSLCDGVLRLEVDKPTYERMGLEGKAIPSEGRKHVKARFLIELNLRLPSMVHGKSGFQRIVWAFRNVLNHSLKWVFYDLRGPNDGTGPISLHQPLLRDIEPQKRTFKAASVPDFTPASSDVDPDVATEILEWLTLAISGSPRVQQDRDIDPYLCRYSAPHGINGTTDVLERKPQDLVCFHWHGFIPPGFIQSILLAALKASGADWFALNAMSFGGEAYTFLQSKEHTMTWEYKD